MRRLATLVAIVALTGLVTSAYGLQILTPAGSDEITGYFVIENMFDDQPTWDGSKPTGGGGGGTGAVGYLGRSVYVDFGPDYADLRIYQTWTLYSTLWGPLNDAGFATMNWSDAGFYYWGGSSWVYEPQNPVAETTLNFTTGVRSDNSVAKWELDVDTSGSPVTPARQYLLMDMPAGTGQMDPMKRSGEWAFVGIPEPATVGLLVIGGLGMLLRRRR